MERIHAIKVRHYLMALPAAEADAEEHALTTWAVALNIAVLVNVSLAATLLMLPKIRLSLLACI